jgi:hypothetical protein
MKKHYMHIGVFISLLILLTGFKKNTQHQTFLSAKSINANSSVSSFAEPLKVSIANARAIQVDKGQRPVKVLVYLSRAATEPVTVKYSTKNGSAKAGVDYVATNGLITFQPGEAAKWITVLIIGEVAADPDENVPVNNFADFIIDLSQATGAILDMASAYITIIQNLSRNPSIIAGNQAIPGQAVYEVIFSFKGYTTLYGNNTEECGIRKDGIVVLSGLLSGVENVASDDDITYTGDLDMIIDIDICSAHRLQGSSEDKWCGIRVNGSGKVFTELEMIYGTHSEGRGGYIKIENKDGQFKRTVTGECGEQNDDEWTMVPNKSISSVFNGTELNMMVDVATGKQLRTLKKGIYFQTDEAGNVTTVEVLRKIR